MAYRTSDGRWRATARVSGRRISQNFRTKLLAEQWERRVKDGVVDPLAAPPPEVPTFREFVETWRLEHGQVELADSTLVVFEARLRAHVLPAFGDWPLDRITVDQCLALRAALAAKLKPSSANATMDGARHVFRVAVARKLIPESPWAGVKRLRREQQTFGFWTAIERDRFLNHCRHDDPALAELVTVAVHTGLRWGELHALRRRHLDLDRRTVLVVANYRPSVRREVERTKSGRAGLVPLNEAANLVLRTRALCAPDDHVFCPKLLEAARRGRLDAVAARAGVRRIRFHDLRHTFGTLLAHAGVHAATIKDLMRHASLAMTERYLHTAADHLAVDVERLCGTHDLPGTDLTPMTLATASISTKYPVKSIS